MKTFNAMLSLVILALMSLMFSGRTWAQQAPANFGGNWTMYSTNIDDGQTVIKHVQISQYGNEISGYFEGPNQSGPIQGEVTGNRIHFVTVTRTILNFHGEIFGNTIAGNYILHGRQAPWQAVRSVGIGAAPETYAPQASNVAQSNRYAPTAPSNAPQSDGYTAPTAAPLSSDQLDSLVAPIALYPDALVAQVLAAATNPDEVTQANQWLSQNANLTGQSLEQAVDQEDWDPSIKALTQFPSVLANLATNLPWTSSLGQAFHYQQSDVMAAVQAMRAKAQVAGTLHSNSQITVTQPSSGVIVIQPANPQVVYVPQYNPTIVYGAPIVVPMYTPPVVYATPALSFGVGVAFGAGGWAVGGGFGWGFHAWACNWGGWGGGGGGNTIIYNHNTYINNNTWHSTSYNGYHPGWGPGSNHPNPYVGPNGGWHPGSGPNDRPYNPTTNPNGYHPGDDTHYGPNGGYHPNGYYGPNGGYHHDVPGTNPADQPNGGNNGNHGLIGGNGGVQNPNAGRNGPGVAPAGGYHNDDGRNANRSSNLSSSRMSGDGRTTRTESNRGRSSMATRRPQQHTARAHAPVEHHAGGGGGGRRR